MSYQDVITIPLPVVTVQAPIFEPKLIGKKTRLRDSDPDNIQHVTSDNIKVNIWCGARIPPHFDNIEWTQVTERIFTATISRVQLHKLNSCSEVGRLEIIKS